MGHFKTLWGELWITPLKIWKVYSEAAQLLHESGKADERVVKQLQSWLTGNDTQTPAATDLRYNAALLLIKMEQVDERVITAMVSCIGADPEIIVPILQRIRTNQPLSDTECGALHEVFAHPDGHDYYQKHARRWLYEWLFEWLVAGR